MTSDTDLDLIFKNAAGKKITLNIEEPKSGLTKAEIDAAMQVVVFRRRHRGSCGRSSAYYHAGSHCRVMKRGPLHGDCGSVQLH